MPLYSWRAITLSGAIQYGHDYAQTYALLDSYLINNHLSLLSALPKKYFLKKREQWITDFFKDIATLLRAGVYLDKALLIVAQQQKNAYCAAMVKDIHYAVEQGHYFHQAMQYHPDCFSSLMIAMLQAGQQSGQLAQAMLNLVDYIQIRQTFYRKMCTALLVPSITLLIFLIVSLVIFIVIVPAFVTSFEMMSPHMPAITQHIITVSTLINSSKGMSMVGLGILAIGGISVYIYRCKKYYFNKILLSIPLISKMIIATNRLHFLQALGLMLKHHIDIKSALHWSADAVSNSYLKKKFKELESYIDQGHTLDYAMQQTQWWSNEIITLVAIGQQSDCLAVVVLQAAQRSNTVIESLLNYCTTLIYPLFMILLGILVTMLIMAVYMPIFNISSFIA